MSTVSDIASSGMQAAQAWLQASASNIANASTPGFRRVQVVQSAGGSGGVDTSTTTAAAAGNALDTDVLGLDQARDAFMANMTVFRTNDRLLGTLLDVSS